MVTRQTLSTAATLSVVALLVLLPTLTSGYRNRHQQQQQQQHEEKQGEFNETEQKLQRGSNRRGKLFSVFQVITFPNDACNGGGSKNGTCYTEAECNSRGGSSDGTCADGFGVCCVLTLNCGGMSSENCTYFDNSGATAGGCRATICPCGDNICQMRLDFTSFTIAGPSTSTQSVTTIGKGGTVSLAGTMEVSLASQCLTDTFQVTNGGGGINPPTICGVNTGEHMYVDMCGQNCNDLVFTLGSTGVGTTIPTRAWSIKVTQYSCSFQNLAPQGCVQYFFGSTTGTVMSYNFNSGNGRQLANQDQSICFRRERGSCRICYSAALTDFDISGNSDTQMAVARDSVCGAYSGAATMLTKGNDVLQVPGAVNAANNMVVSNLCGRSVGLNVVTAAATMAPAAAQTVCSTLQPFVINFHSDAWEHAPDGTDEATAANNGFRLGYAMDAINC